MGTRKDKYQIEFSAAQVARLQKAATEAGFSSLEDYILSLHSAQARSDDFEPSFNSAASAPTVAFKTKFGRAFSGDSAALARSRQLLRDGSVDLIMTSPPFGLVRKKDYGNEDADRYVRWFEQFSDSFHRVLKDSGSLVIDIGGAWRPGVPCKSLYHYELLVMLCRKYGFHLAQEFFWWNPAKLPTPAEWVNVRRVRVKDAINCVWWLSKTPYPKASNRRILQPYSKSMTHLIKHGYKAKLRPSGHDISGPSGFSVGSPLM